MISGSFVGTTPCPAYLSMQRCPAPANVYDMDGSGSNFTSICVGANVGGGNIAGPHQQFFGDYYLTLVNTGSSPA